jgi:hypothetical protein
MRIPPQVKPALWGAAGGAIVWWVVLAFGFGWTSAGTTEKLASGRAEKAVVAALAPVCAERFNAQPETRDAQRHQLVAEARPLSQRMGDIAGRLISKLRFGRGLFELDSQAADCPQVVSPVSAGHL